MNFDYSAVERHIMIRSTSGPCPGETRSKPSHRDVRAAQLSSARISTKHSRCLYVCISVTINSCNFGFLFSNKVRCYWMHLNTLSSIIMHLQTLIMTSKSRKQKHYVRTFSCRPGSFVRVLYTKCRHHFWTPRRAVFLLDGCPLSKPSNSTIWDAVFSSHIQWELMKLLLLVSENKQLSVDI